jgi:DNA-directed RNA polymerase sigma subunit (sigma70/sigma32)
MDIRCQGAQDSEDRAEPISLETPIGEEDSHLGDFIEQGRGFAVRRGHQLEPEGTDFLGVEDPDATRGKVIKMRFA